MVIANMLVMMAVRIAVQGVLALVEVLAQEAVWVVAKQAVI